MISGIDSSVASTFLKEMSDRCFRHYKMFYAASFNKAKGDKDLLTVAEEGITDSLEQLMSSSKQTSRLKFIGSTYFKKATTSLTVFMGASSIGTCPTPSYMINFELGIS